MSLLDRINKNILRGAPYVPGKPIQEVERELGLKDIVKLASNENPYGPSPKVLRAIAQAAKDVNRYPEGGCFEMRQALAKRLKISPDQLIFGAGCDEVIVFAARVFLEPGDEVVVARPSFLIYDIASRVCGATVKEVPLKGFQYDLAAIRSTITDKTKIVFIGNPDNPCGTYVSAQALEDFLKTIPNDVLIFVDEAYGDFVQAKDYPDTLKLFKTFKNLLIGRTFSKLYGLAGLRIGYGIGDKDLIAMLERVREPFNTTSVAQAAAVACLADKKYYQGILKKILAQKVFLCKSFDKMGVEFSKTATNFILIKVKEDTRVVADKLLKKGVIVRDMTSWGLKEYIRVTVGKEQENKKLIRALEEIL